MEPSTQPTVLITANRYRLAEVIAKGLRRDNWTTVIAVDYGDSLTRLKGHGFQWFILDLDGLDERTLGMLTQLQDTCKIPILLLSSDRDRGDHLCPHFATVPDLLIKPFKIQDIVHSGHALHPSHRD